MPRHFFRVILRFAPLRAALLIAASFALVWLLGHALDAAHIAFQWGYAVSGGAVVFLIPVAFVVAKRALMIYAPNVDGSGFFDVVDVLKGAKLPANLAPRDVAGRMIFTPISALLGGSVGAFGPAMHMLAALWCWLGKCTKPTAIYAGVAVVFCYFGAPVAGLVFALEMRTSEMHKSTVHSRAFHQALFLPAILAMIGTLYWQAWPRVMSEAFHMAEFANMAALVSMLFWLLLLLLAFERLRDLAIHKRFAYMEAAVCGAGLAILLAFNGGISAQLLNNHTLADMVVAVPWWQWFIANALTVMSGVSAGMVAPLAAMGGALAVSYGVHWPLGAALALTIALRVPFSMAFFMIEAHAAHALTTLALCWAVHQVAQQLRRGLVRMRTL